MAAKKKKHHGKHCRLQNVTAKGRFTKKNTGHKRRVCSGGRKKK